MEDFITALKEIARIDDVGEGDQNADEYANDAISIARDVLEERGIDYE